MEVRSTMRPGQKGTRKLVARFGERLIFVRYRYDVKLKKRFTTAELIVDEVDWAPSPPPLVHVKVEYQEVAVRRQVRAPCGQWDLEKKAWLLPLDQVRKLGLQKRISPS